MKMNGRWIQKRKSGLQHQQKPKKLSCKCRSWMKLTVFLLSLWWNDSCVCSAAWSCNTCPLRTEKQHHLPEHLPSTSLPRAKDQYMPLHQSPNPKVYLSKQSSTTPINRPRPTLLGRKQSSLGDAISRPASGFFLKNQFWVIGSDPSSLTGGFLIHMVPFPERGGARKDLG